MSNLQTNLQPLIEKLEAAGKNAKNLAELEQVVIEHSRQLAQQAFAELSQEVQEGISPPDEQLWALPRGTAVGREGAAKGAEPVGEGWGGALPLSVPPLPEVTKQLARWELG
jgi:hypothetical protein